MIIDFGHVKTYKKLILKMVDSNQPLYDSILLDFVNQEAYFGSQKGFGKVKMPVTNLDPSAKPFFVNASAFLTVVEEFPVLELEGFTFKSGKDTFEVAHISDESFEYPDFISSSDELDISFDKGLTSSIKKALSFTDPEASASLNGVFIQKGNIFGTNKLRLYGEYRDELKAFDIALPQRVCETLVLDVLEGEVHIRKNESQFLLSKGDEITLQFGMSNVLEGPDVSSANFKKFYDHEMFISLNKNDLLEVSSFFQNFVSNVANNRVQLIFHEDELEVKTEDGNVVSRKVKLSVKADTYFQGQKVWVSNAWLKTILSLLPGEKLVLQISFDKPSINFRVEENEDVHVVYSRLKETV